MPTFRIVYIDDDTFAPRTLTADFRDRASAEIAMARHGHRVVHVAELGSGEIATDPIRISIAAEAERHGAAGVAPARERPPPPWLRALPRYDVTGIALAAVGIVAAGAAFLLF